MRSQNEIQLRTTGLRPDQKRLESRFRLPSNESFFSFYCSKRVNCCRETETPKKTPKDVVTARPQVLGHFGHLRNLLVRTLVLTDHKPEGGRPRLCPNHESTRIEGRRKNRTESYRKNRKNGSKPRDDRTHTSDTSVLPGVCVNLLTGAHFLDFPSSNPLQRQGSSAHHLSPPSPSGNASLNTTVRPRRVQASCLIPAQLAKP